MSEFRDPLPTPEEPHHDEAVADEASAESFPSSDPPASYAGPDEATSRVDGDADEDAEDESAPDDPDD
jgi:hypothetical protein